MDGRWVTTLTRWTDADLIDEQTAERIRAFETERAGATRLGWPVVLALACGGLMLAAGVLLFVSANWDAMSPAMRFALVILLVAAFHLAGASVAERFPNDGDIATRGRDHGARRRYLPRRADLQP